MKVFGRIIRELRKEKDCTQGVLASVLGVTQDSISLWENDKRIPDTQYVIEMAKFFGVSADYLLGLSDEFISVKSNNGDEYLSAEEIKMIKDYRDLSDRDKSLLTEYVKLLKK